MTRAGLGVITSQEERNNLKKALVFLLAFEEEACTGHHRGITGAGQERFRAAAWRLTLLLFIEGAGSRGAAWFLLMDKSAKELR